MTDDTPLTEAELTRLADDSLAESARAQACSRVARSPELQERLREQQHGVALMRSTDALTAPDALRTAVAGLAPPQARPRAWAVRLGRIGPLGGLARWRPALVPLAGGVALLVAAVLLLGGGSSKAPTVDETAHLALAAALTPAPAVDTADHDLLSVRAAGIQFPSYAASGDWQASGARTDTLSGRTVRTVFYRDPRGDRVGYSIVSGSALTPPTGRTVSGGAVLYVLSSSGSAKLITWSRNGHTCVIAGDGVDERMLIRLAAADARTT